MRHMRNGHTTWLFTPRHAGVWSLEHGWAAALIKCRIAIAERALTGPAGLGGWGMDDAIMMGNGGRDTGVPGGSLFLVEKKYSREMAKEPRQLLAAPPRPAAAVVHKPRRPPAVAVAREPWFHLEPRKCSPADFYRKGEGPARKIGKTMRARQDTLDGGGPPALAQPLGRCRNNILPRDDQFRIGHAGDRVSSIALELPPKYGASLQVIFWDISAGWHDVYE